MTRPSASEPSTAAAIVAAKWKPRIVRELAAAGPAGFGDLKRRLGSVSNKVLADDLDALQEYGVVDRSVVSEEPLRVEYRLTEGGRALDTLLDDLSAWDESYLGGGTTRILVADDDETMSDLYAAVLGKEYDVFRASNGREALSALDESVDLAVVDRRMPGLSGDEVANRCEELGIDCPIVVCTAFGPDESVLDLPIDAYLTKPVSPTELRETVVSVLARRGLTAREREYRALASRLEAVSEESPDPSARRSAAYRDALDRLESLETALGDN
jgi:DNA-binding HxlR family transcriptional regulator